MNNWRQGDFSILAVRKGGSLLELTEDQKHKVAVCHITIYATRESKRWLITYALVNEWHAKCISLFAA
jgi:hypothetical protein